MALLQWVLAAGALGVVGWLATRGRPAPFDVEANLDGGRLVPGRDGRLYERAVGAGADIVMLPGFAGSARTWDVITPRLAQRYCVRWLDLLGHGLADKPAFVDYGAFAQAGRIAEWMAAAGVRRTVVVASSAGAQPAVALAAEHPGRVAGLVLVAPFLTANPSVRLGLRIARRFPGTSAAIVRTALRQRWVVWGANMLGRSDPFTVQGAVVDRQYRPFGAPGFFEALPSLLATVDPADVDQAIERVGCPVLLVWGAADLTAATGQALALTRRFARGEAQVLPNAGHLAQEETPDDLLGLMEPFLARVTGPG